MVCQHHTQAEHALLIAERVDSDTQYIAAFSKRADDWFAKHQACGRTRDHFRLAFGKPQDWDVSPPAEATVAGGVRFALVNGSKPE